ncbi:MAG: WD40 repeat domain-containing protein, partial [Anaerolineae bacterium]|nr:WD40 repeat domain-containing protein [Anaerolineae bacterium]
LIRAAQLILPDDGSELMLVIDQFEEVFTLLEDEAARIHFLNLLYMAVTEPRSRVRVIITLRADFYDRPLHYTNFGELIRSRMETLLPLSAQELERAISKPAEHVGASFEPGLVASIVAEVNYQAGALPLLQYALTELFEQRKGRLLTREAYDAIGGSVGALARRADEVYTEFNAVSQEAARQMFLRLVTLGEGIEDTRRRVTRSELLSITLGPDMMDEVIDTYVEYRLLSLDNDPGTHTPTVELAHEAILRAWERLNHWLNENRDEIKAQRQLSAMAAEWRTSKQDTSFLARGARLEQFEKWVADTRLALTGAERAYLNASVAQRTLEEKAEHERKAREKILERRSVRFLRGLVVVLVLATLGAFGLTGIAVSESQSARLSAAEAQNVALVAGSQAALANSNTDQAIALALQAVTLNPSSASAQVALGQAGYEPGTVRRYMGHTDEVWGVAFSADNRTAVSSSKDGTLILWDVATGKIIHHFTGGHSPGAELRVDMSSDGHSLLSGAMDGLVLLWDVATGKIIGHLEGHSGGVKCVKFSPNGRTALSCGQDKTLILWDAQTGSLIRRFTGHTNVVESANFSPNGHMILSGSDDKTLILWDAETGSLIRQFKSPNEVYSVTFSRDGQQAFIGLRDGSGYLLDLTTGETLQHFIGHTRTLFSAVFTPDGKHILTGGVDKWVGYWDVGTGQLIRRFEGHSATVTQVVLTADGRYVLSASADMTERLWDLESGQLIRRFEGHKGFVFFVKISPDGRTGISTSDDGTAVLWDIETGQKLQRLTLPSGNGTTDAAYLLDGKKALIATGDPSYTIFVPGDIILWDLATGEEIHRFKGHQAQVAALSISPDGLNFLSGAIDGTMFLWNIETGQIIRRFEGNPQWVATVAFSPDGRTALSGGHGGNLLMWDVQTGKNIQNLVGHTGIVGDVKFLQDGNRALSGGQSDALLWDLSKGSVIGHFPGGKVISPDEHLIFGDFGAYPVLWDVATSTIIREYGIADRRAYFNAFTPDSRSVLLGFSDGGLELWRLDATLNDLLTWIRDNRYIPDLTCEQRDLYRLEPLCKASDDK